MRHQLPARTELLPHGLTKGRSSMVYRQVVLSFAVIVLGLVPSAVRSDEANDLANVRAVFNEDIRLFNAHNKDAFVTSAHNDVVLFGILSPFATKGKEALQQLVQDYIDDHVG